MDILERIEEMADMLRENCEDMTADELYEQARMEHLWALGSSDDDEATDHEIAADAYRLLARERENYKLVIKYDDCVEEQYEDVIGYENAEAWFDELKASGHCDYIEVYLVLGLSWENRDPEYIVLSWDAEEGDK